MTGQSARPAMPLAHDPGLPHRDVLLDPLALAGRLPAVLGLPARSTVGSITRLRAKYRPGRTLRVTHSVTVGSATHVVSTRMVRPERAAPLLESVDSSDHRVDGLRATAPDGALDSVSWVFPHDRRLLALEGVIGRTAAVHRAVGKDWASSKLMAYAPEKSATLCCLDGVGNALGYAKIYADSDAAESALVRADAATHLQRAGQVRVPRVLAYLPEHHLLVFEALMGEQLARVAPTALAEGLEALGRGLATLHRVPGDDLPPFTRFSSRSLQSSAQLIAVARPDMGPLARRVVDALSAAPPAGGSSLLHGDAHLKNALVTAEGIALIDLDQAAVGSAAADVAGVVATLRKARRIGALTVTTEARLVRRFLAAYAEVAGPLDEASLRWHTAAALLVERAARAVSRVLPEVLDRLDAVLADALDIAEQGQPPVGARRPALVGESSW